MGFRLITPPRFGAPFSTARAGIVYASANIRGGGELWREMAPSGMKLHKQNVFDDFIAAAEWLIAGKNIRRAKSWRLLGASNGGLLIGAVLNQRPELFRAASRRRRARHAPLSEIHHRSDWTADYGSIANPEEFKALRAYSPLHNIARGEISRYTDHDSGSR